ncbi:hypothetical protein KR054_004545, partial [Drosophila jambulina]
MAISRKEIIAALLLIAAVSGTWLEIADPVNLPCSHPQVLNVLNGSYFANIVQLHSSYEQLAYQVVCIGTAYICLIYALSTWLYHSNYHRSRQEMRFVLATMLVLMIVCISVSTYFFNKKMSYDKLTECMDLRLLFTSIANAGRTISIVLSILCILLLLVALLMVLFKIFRS